MTLLIIWFLIWVAAIICALVALRYISRYNEKHDTTPDYDHTDNIFFSNDEKNL